MSMTTRSEAKVEKLKPPTLEKGIRPAGPSRWEDQAYVRRNSEAGKVEHLNCNTSRGNADDRRAGICGLLSGGRVASATSATTPPPNR